ncbi:spermatogenesis-associated protein 1 isoform X2 [Pelobates fuscus]|uniref:spermatogenesis-associated protein 1 isoform X2 n=1 Tax=Pelobates fuscus TaxID=191477 RepID=UPI002FE471E0
METNETSRNPSFYPTRPSTAGLIDLHVYYVPDEVWNPKLNKVPSEAINKFISVGFIRVPPDMMLKTLRERLGELLGDDPGFDKFAFLKCVGRSLALVKAKQELEVKVKSFAPPYASDPELYLLPGVEGEGSSYASSVTPAGYNVEHPPWDQPFIHPATDSSRRSPKALLREKDRNPLISRSKEQEGMPSVNLLNYPRQSVDEQLTAAATEKRSNLLNKTEDLNTLAIHPGTNTASDSGISDTFQGPEHFHRKRSEHFLFPIGSETQSVNRSNQFADNSFRTLPEPAQYHAPPTPPLLTMFPPIKSLPTEGTRHETLLEQLEKVKEERVKLERSREELIKKTKSLLEQYKLRRHQVRDSWKKKYFETKKLTSALEETLNKLRTELESSYQKLLTQLAARDNRNRTKYPALTASSKNSVIMNITSRQQEVEQLRRRVDDARIKLLIEIKMRKQAASDLNVLKAQLAQKKAQSTIINHNVFAI